MELENLEIRLAAVESILRAQSPARDHSAEIKEIKTLINQIGRDASTALARRIPQTGDLVTRSELQNALKTLAGVTASSVVEGERALKTTVERKFDQTVGAIHTDVQAAKNAAHSSGVFAAGMLLTKSGKLGR